MMKANEFRRVSPALGSQIDRLVDGELPEIERVDLLRRLETETDGWRLCALAFLEAQSWREAMQPLAAEATKIPLSAVEKPSSSRHRRRVPIGFIAMAAALLLMFGLGWLAHGNPGKSAGDERMAQGDQSSRQGGTGPVPESEPQAGSMPVASSGGSLKSEPESAARTLQPSGLRAEMHPRLASVLLKDGRRVQVPVQEVHLRYVGNRTY